MIIFFTDSKFLDSSWISLVTKNEKNSFHRLHSYSIILYSLITYVHNNFCKQFCLISMKNLEFASIGCHCRWMFVFHLAFRKSSFTPKRNKKWMEKKERLPSFKQNAIIYFSGNTENPKLSKFSKSLSWVNSNIPLSIVVDNSSVAAIPLANLIFVPAFSLNIIFLLIEGYFDYRKKKNILHRFSTNCVSDFENMMFILYNERSRVYLRSFFFVYTSQRSRRELPVFLSARKSEMREISTGECWMLFLLSWLSDLKRSKLIPNSPFPRTKWSLSRLFSDGFWTSGFSHKIKLRKKNQKITKSDFSNCCRMYEFSCGKFFR